MVKVTIEGMPKEIAALVDAIQKQQEILTGTDLIKPAKMDFERGIMYTPFRVDYTMGQCT